MIDVETISESIKKLDSWIEKNDWKGYDPFDGLSARSSKLLTLNNHYLKIAWQQSVRRLPINIRPLLGIKQQTGSKGLGFSAMGYLKLFQATQDDRYLNKMKYCLDWLSKNYSKGYSGYAWGNHFHYESRGGDIPLGIPSIVWTSWIGVAFLNAFEVLNDKKYFDIAKSAADFIVNDIKYYELNDNAICFMYTPAKGISFNRTIHNSNVLGAWLLARLYKHTKNEKYFELSRKSVNFAMECQLDNGAWYYGEPKKYQWIDNFHTGYNLEAIHGYIKATGDRTHLDKLIKGYKFFIDTFFEEDGLPRYYDYKRYPIDIQCASQAIQTLVNLREYDDRSLDLAKKVAQWTIENMQDYKGFFYFRKYPLMTNKTPMFHWGQATMLSALGHLYEGLKANGKDQPEA